MLRAILNKSWQQHPTRHQLYDHLLPITKTIQVRRSRHAGHCWRSRDEIIRDVLLWNPTHGRAKAGRPPRTYIQQLCEDTGCCPEGRWTIGKSGERGSGISVLPARDDDDDDERTCFRIIMSSLITVLAPNYKAFQWDHFSWVLPPKTHFSTWPWEQTSCLLCELRVNFSMPFDLDHFEYYLARLIVVLSPPFWPCRLTWDYYYFIQGKLVSRRV